MSDKNLAESKNVKGHYYRGQLFQELDKTNVIWKIPNFTRNLSDHPSPYYISTPFAFSDAAWYLSLYPNLEGYEGYIALYISMRGKYSCEFSYTMSIRNTEGNPEFSTSGSRKFEGSFRDAGRRKFWSKSKLMDRKSELLPDDTLTVECRLERGKSVVEVSQIERLLKLQFDLGNILDEKKSCDLIFKLQGQEIKAHKLIMENRCEVFKRMLSHDMVERKTGEITIEDIEPDVFREVLEYMYCGGVQNLSSDNMCELYVAADKYNLLELKRVCATFIAENLSVDLFPDVLAIPEICIDDELKRTLKQFFCKNFMSIIVTEKWKNFDEKNKEVTHELFLSTLKANAGVLKPF